MVVVAMVADRPKRRHSYRRIKATLNTQHKVNTSIGSSWALKKTAHEDTLFLKLAFGLTASTTEEPLLVAE